MNQKTGYVEVHRFDPFDVFVSRLLQHKTFQELGIKIAATESFVLH